VDRKPGLPVLDQSAGLPGAERTAPTDQKERLEQARLAGAVRTEEVVPLRIQAAVDVAEEPPSVYSESFQRHAPLPAAVTAASRILRRVGTRDGGRSTSGRGERLVLQPHGHDDELRRFVVAGD